VRWLVLLQNGGLVSATLGSLESATAKTLSWRYIFYLVQILLKPTETAENDSRSSRRSLFYVSLLETLEQADKPKTKDWSLNAHGCSCIFVRENIKISRNAKSQASQKGGCIRNIYRAKKQLQHIQKSLLSS
jgi:hypothetical protein